jgi:acyl-CoA reductase-like NAD-dependent aldehyde dehydrogenase
LVIKSHKKRSMKETTKDLIIKNIANHRAFFLTQKTKGVPFRLTQLHTLKKAILEYQEEIFGPILPVMTFNHIDEPINYINKNEKPLAFHYFGKNKNVKEVLSKTTSGGACINDTLMHITNDN